MKVYLVSKMDLNLILKAIFVEWLMAYGTSNVCRDEKDKADG